MKRTLILPDSLQVGNLFEGKERSEKQLEDRKAGKREATSRSFPLRLTASRALGFQQSREESGKTEEAKKSHDIGDCREDNGRRLRRILFHSF